MTNLEKSQEKRSKLIYKMALQEQKTEIEFLKKYLDINDWDIKKTAFKLGVYEQTLRKSMERNGIYNVEPSAQKIRSLFKGNYEKQDAFIIEQCLKLKKDNPMISFKSFRQIISVLIMNERTKNLGGL